MVLGTPEIASSPLPESPPTRGFGPTANTLLAYTLVVGLRLSLSSLILPLYLYSLGYKQDVIGVVTAAGALTTLVFAVPLGLLADRVGRARLFVFSAWLLPWPSIGTALSTNLIVIIGCQMLLNLVATIYWSTNAPLLVGSVNAEQRVRAFAMNSFFLTGVGTLGAALGGGISALAGRLLGVPSNATAPLRVALLALAVLTFVGAVPLLRLRAAREKAARGRAWRFQRSDLPRFARLIIVDALMAFGAGAVIGFLPIFFAVRYGMASGALGVLFTLTGALSGIASLLAPVIARRLGDHRALLTAQIAIAPAIFLIAIAPVLPLAIAFEATRNALRGLLDPVYTPFAMMRVPSAQRGALGGLYNVTWATGFSLGPLLSGWIQVHAGFAPAFTMSAVCYLVAAVCTFAFFRRSQAIED